ncbi:hypothetical protein GCM10009038_32990 [Salinicola rhizosphaerae]|uniref:DUF1850 domain-containing protein n=2 Tax=Salinicola rhizosphaerae TaxID=1443141 RepID=A0ABQ3EGK7_9GAMM|nr:hypothetical protein GCM10009038_32990 [Salinicola rhizosphaerae]
MTRGRWMLAAAVATVLITAATVPLPWLAVRDGHDWRFALPGWHGTTFKIRWMHSVEKEDWEEWFAITPSGAIEITGTRFKTFGAGVPSHAGTETHLDDGWVVMTGIDRVVDPYAVQAAVEEHYRLIFHGRAIALSRSDPPPILTFAVVDAPLWQALPALVRTLNGALDSQ